MLHPVKKNKPVWCGEDLGRSGDSAPRPAAAAAKTRDLVLRGQVWPYVGPLKLRGDSDLAKV